MLADLTSAGNFFFLSSLKAGTLFSSLAECSWSWDNAHLIIFSTKEVPDTNKVKHLIKVQGKTIPRIQEEKVKVALKLFK